MWRDRTFHAALLVAPAFWALLFLLLHARPDWSWPLRYPENYLMPALVYPVLEEIVFRGLLQELIHEHVTRGAFGPLSSANVITSVIFTALHFVHHPPLWAALVFLPSLVFGYFKDKYRSLRPAIILHVFYNAGFIWLFSAPQ
jgi:membrane protease YdiL (CAAX protease family)